MYTDTVTGTFRRLFLVLVICVVLAGAATALNTRLNITIKETVNQNVTYAKNFNLVENRTYAVIEGVITFTNPGNETIYDINSRLNNVSNLATNFVNTGGRPGYEVVFPHVNDSVQNITGNITTSWKSLGMDLDEDGTNDTVRLVNNTIQFNLSSQYDLYTINLSNSTNASINISNVPVALNMNFNLTSITHTGEYNDNVTFAYVTINGTETTAGQLTLGSQITMTVNNTARNYSILHIPELRPGQDTIFNYNVSSLLVNPPLDINSSYTNPEFQTKVLAGQRFWVRLTAGNIENVGTLENVNVTLAAQSVNVSNASSSELFNFTLHNLSTNSSISDDYQWVDNTTNRTWYWTVNNGSIAIGHEYNISFQIQAPDTVSSSGTYLALLQTLQYRINTTASTLGVSNVRAHAAVIFNTSKRIVSPQDNLSNHNVTWESIPRVGTNDNITFSLEKVSVWVTNTLDPNQPTNISKNYTPGTTINASTLWTGAAWLFNYTDGSSDANPPPIVWVKPYWIIKNTANQIVSSSVTVNGTDLYMNYIYVVNGYWLDVQKKVLDAGNNTYNIRIVVRNRGNGYTPQNMTVTVYDFIPSDFSASNFSPMYNNASNVTGQFAGVAYRWDVGLRTNLSTSFAPKGDPSGLDYYYLNYTVNGSGNFKVSDLYIVGLDPRAVNGANTFRGVSVISNIASTSKEVIYLAIVLFLIGINVANFMMTSRINRKLDRK